MIPNDTTPRARPSVRPVFDRLAGRVVLGIALAVALLGAVGGWAMTARLTGAVIAMGTVKVDENIKRIQHRDGGIIAEIAVSEGDEIAAGQVLFRLDDVQSRAELSILSAQLAEAEARRARLIADRNGDTEIRFPAEILGRGPAGVEDVVAGEIRLHEGNLANRQNQRQQLELGVEQIGEEIAAMEAQRAAVVEELAMVEESHSRLDDLASRGLLESTRLEQSARDRVQLRGRLGEIDANIARSRARIGEVRMRILAIDEIARNEAQRELVTVESRISELSDRRAAVADRLTRTEIRAPIAGTINELSVFTVGGVITPAEVLATIVPADADLRIEVRLPVTAIDQVYLDQPARVRFSAFNHRTTPELKARMVQVSPATALDTATGESFYVGRVELDPGEAAKLGGLELLPGMPAEVYLATQEQTAAMYFVRPLLDQVERAFREE